MHRALALILSLVINGPTWANDPLLHQQWAIPSIEVSSTWNEFYNAEPVTIAILDSGIDLDHPDLVDNLWVNQKEKDGLPNVDDDQNGYVDDIHGFNFINPKLPPNDVFGHGTHCAGIIGAVHNNGIGIRGVVPNVRLMAVKTLQDDGEGNSKIAAEAIRYAVDNGAKIISASWNGDNRIKSLEKALKYAHDAGVMFINAAGNNGALGKDNDIGGPYPSNYDLDNIIVVASHNEAGKLTPSSHYGRSTVDIVAPGDQIFSTLPDDKYAFKSGTSMAAPFVAGALGLLYQQEGNISVKEARDVLLNNTIFSFDFRKKIVSNGRLSVKKLLDNLRPPHFEPEGWQIWEENISFSSHHPYPENSVYLKVVNIPDVHYSRVVFDRIELGSGDRIEIIDMNGLVIDKIEEGRYRNFTSDFITGGSFFIRFEANRWIHRWGFNVSHLEVIF